MPVCDVKNSRAFQQSFPLCVHKNQCTHFIHMYICVYLIKFVDSCSLIFYFVFLEKLLYYALFHFLVQIICRLYSQYIHQYTPLYLRVSEQVFCQCKTSDQLQMHLLACHRKHFACCCYTPKQHFIAMACGQCDIEYWKENKMVRNIDLKSRQGARLSS